jgi:hypothetical protein
VVLRNVVIDQSGFREALLVSGPPGSRPAPLIDGCVVKCSGDDAVNVAGGGARVGGWLRDAFRPVLGRPVQG